MNFKIVEGTRETDNLYYSFVEEYNKGTLMNDIRLKLGLNTKKYSDYYHRALDNEDIVSRRDVRISNSKYYYNTSNGCFMICKRNNDGVQEYYGVYKSEDEARNMVALLVENDWDRNVIYGNEEK